MSGEVDLLHPALDDGRRTILALHLLRLHPQLYGDDRAALAKDLQRLAYEERHGQSPKPRRGRPPNDVTQDDIAKAIKLRKQGLSHKAIAESLGSQGRSENWVAKNLSRVGCVKGKT